MFEQYWKAVLIFSDPRLDGQQLEFACRKLIEAVRPESAIGILSGVTFREVAVAVAGSHGCPDRVPGMGHNPIRIRNFDDDTVRIVQFGSLDGFKKHVPFGNDEPTQRLAQLEWAFQLDGSGTYVQHAPKTLVRCLSEYPKFFAELIAAIFHSKNEQRVRDEID